MAKTIKLSKQYTVKCDFQHPLGKGAGGFVLLGKDEATGQAIAAKRILHDGSSDEMNIVQPLR